MGILLFNKFKENLYAVFPVTLIVILLNFTLVPIPTNLLFRFLMGSFLVVIGLSFFLVGVDTGITPLGSHIGLALARSNKLYFVILFGLIVGFFISIAEPGLLVLSGQIELVTMGKLSSTVILVIVSIGLATLMSFGLIRIFYNMSLRFILLGLYGIIFILSMFTSPEFFAMAFDASGATTGILAVPFILSLSIGISALKKDSKASETDSFGLVSIASCGTIIAVMLLDIFSDTTEFSSNLNLDFSTQSTFFHMLKINFLGVFRESFFSLLPLLVTFLIFQKFSFKLDSKSFKKLLLGFVYAFGGLLIFFLGIGSGFMDVGILIGSTLASFDTKIYVAIIGFILGVVTIVAEPAVYVLTQQIENITSGYIVKKYVLVFLSLGVGLAILLSTIRILIPGIQLWHYLLPGYIIALALTFFTPKLFVGIAFDAGGVATGPMTATFVFSFTQGIADSFEGASLLLDGFGMISMVALMPIISLEILGILYKIAQSKEKKLS